MDTRWTPVEIKTEKVLKLAQNEACQAIRATFPRLRLPVRSRSPAFSDSPANLQKTNNYNKWPLNSLFLVGAAFLVINNGKMDTSRDTITLTRGNL